MARYHYWQYIVDEEGRPLEDVNIRVYLNDNPTVEADIFTNAVAGSPTTSSEADLETDENGFYEFWIGDAFETLGGYGSTQKFRITWDRAGILIGELDNIDIFPSIFQVDETDTTSVVSSQKNRLVSNALAHKWDTHVDSTYADQPHSFQPVNVNNTNATYNKLVSNSLMNYLFAVMSSAGTLTIDASAAVGRYYTVTAWTPDGDYYYVDLIHNLGRTNPIVQVYDLDNSTQIIPYKITSINSFTTRVYSGENMNAEITVLG